MRPLVIAHRGGAGEGVLENSIQAFKHAITTGCDSIETDLRAAKSGIYCLHDRTLTRTANATGALKNFTPGRLSEIKLKNGEKIPLLKDLLSLAKKKKFFLHLELKEGGFEKELLRELESSRTKKSVLIISFHNGILERIHELDPGIKTGFLLARKSDCNAYPDFCRVILPQFKLATAERIKAWHKAGKRVHVWTLDDPEKALRLAPGVDGIITNVPKAIALILKSRSFC